MDRFAKELLKWYNQHRRDLPWRNTSDPYPIWISEIILQQTRVEQGLPYFLRILEQFPTIEALADASEDEILRLWQGLGYYHRARNMLMTARAIVQHFNGKFPSKYIELKKLKGVGTYVAAAISSIAFGEAVPAVDGNVIRIISRWFAICEPVDRAAGRNKIHSALKMVFDRSHPGDFNQAMMDLGALICKPKNPHCQQCPLAFGCKAFENKVTDRLPLKNRQTRQRQRFFNYLVVTSGNFNDQRFIITQRNHEDIWIGLYEFPLIETSDHPEITGLLNASQWKDIFASGNGVITAVHGPIKYLLTHQQLSVRFIRIRINKPVEWPEGYFWITPDKFHFFPFPQLISNYIQDYILSGLEEE